MDFYICRLGNSIALGVPPLGMVVGAIMLLGLAGATLYHTLRMPRLPIYQLEDKVTAPKPHEI